MWSKERIHMKIIRNGRLVFVLIITLSCLFPLLMLATPIRGDLDAPVVPIINLSDDYRLINPRVFKSPDYLIGDLDGNGIDELVDVKIPITTWSNTTTLDILAFSFNGIDYDVLMNRSVVVPLSSINTRNMGDFYGSGRDNLVLVGTGINATGEYSFLAVVYDFLTEQLEIVEIGSGYNIMDVVCSNVIGSASAEIVVLGWNATRNASVLIVVDNNLSKSEYLMTEDLAPWTKIRAGNVDCTTPANELVLVRDDRFQQKLSFKFISLIDENLYSWSVVERSSYSVFVDFCLKATGTAGVPDDLVVLRWTRIPVMNITENIITSYEVSGSPVELDIQGVYLYNGTWFFKQALAGALESGIQGEKVYFVDPVTVGKYAVVIHGTNILGVFQFSSIYIDNFVNALRDTSIPFSPCDSSPTYIYRSVMRFNYDSYGLKHYQAAKELKDFILTNFPAGSVIDLYGHSYGGIVLRTYMSYFQASGRTIEYKFTMGTPNKGVYIDKNNYEFLQVLSGGEAVIAMSRFITKKPSPYTEIDQENDNIFNGYAEYSIGTSVSSSNWVSIYAGGWGYIFGTSCPEFNGGGGDNIVPTDRCPLGGASLEYLAGFWHDYTMDITTVRKYMATGYANDTCGGSNPYPDPEPGPEMIPVLAAVAIASLLIHKRKRKKGRDI